MKKLLIGLYLFVSIGIVPNDTLAVDLSPSGSPFGKQSTALESASKGALGGTQKSGLVKAAGNALETAGKVISTISGSTTPSTTSGSTVFQGSGLSGGADIVDSELTSTVSKETDIKELIIAWTNFLLPLATVLAVLAVVWAGFLYITAFGDDGRIDSAKKIIMWAVIGLLVIAAAYAIVNFVLSATF